MAGLRIDHTIYLCMFEGKTPSGKIIYIGPDGFPERFGRISFFVGNVCDSMFEGNRRGTLYGKMFHEKLSHVKVLKHPNVSEEQRSVLYDKMSHLLYRQDVDAIHAPDLPISASDNMTGISQAIRYVNDALAPAEEDPVKKEG